VIVWLSLGHWLLSGSKIVQKTKELEIRRLGREGGGSSNNVYTCK
jgi:hypothetical protein